MSVLATKSERELSADIKAGRLANVYLFYGEEGYLKRHCTERIVKKAVSDFFDFNYHRFDRNLKLNDLAAACDSVPMMSDFSVVEVRDYNFAAASDSEHKQLISLLESPNESCILIFVFDETPMPGTKNKKGKAVLDLIGKNGCIVDFERKSEGELSSLLVRRANKRSVNLQPTVAKRVIALCGNDIENLLTEVDKLCDYVGEGGAVSDREVDAIVTRTLDASAFALASAVCSKRRDEAMKICADLFDMKTEPVMIIGALSSVFVDIYRVKAAAAEGLRPEDIAADLGYGKATFKLRNAANNGRYMTQSSAFKALEVLREADLALKTSRSDGRIAVECAIVRLLHIAAGDSE